MDLDLLRPPDRDRYLLADEVGKLLEAARETGVEVHSHLKPEDPHRFLSFQANTGARPAEALLLRAGAFTLQENQVKIQTAKQKKNKRTGKVRKIFRDVDLAKEYVDSLDWLPASPQIPLFDFSYTTAWRIFKRAAAAAGLKKSYSLYSLRHTRAIYLLEWTGDLKYVQQQMGHSSIAITSVYLHCVPSARAKHRKKLGAF